MIGAYETSGSAKALNYFDSETLEKCRKYPFIHTPVHDRGQPEMPAYIDRLPTDSLVMEPSEAQVINYLLQDAEAFADSSYSHQVTRQQTGFRESSLDQFLRQTTNYPLLTKAGELILSRSVMAGQQILLHPNLAPGDNLEEQEAQSELLLTTATMAWTRLVNSNLRLVAKVAMGRRDHMHIEDAVSEGTMGLMHAAAKFDYRRGFRFTTYSINWIRQSIGRATNIRPGLVTIPPKVSGDISLLARELRHVDQVGEEQYQDVARQLGWSQNKLDLTLRAKDMSSAYVSLNSNPIEGSNTTVGDFIVIEETSPTTHLEQIEKDDLYKALFKAVNRLPGKTGEIFKRVTYVQMTQDERAVKDEMGKLADQYGLTKTAIRSNMAMARMMLLHPSLGLSQETPEGEALAGAACEGDAVSEYFTRTASKSKNNKIWESRCAHCGVRGACEDFAMQNADRITEGRWGEVILNSRIEKNYKRRQLSKVPKAG